MSRTEYNNHSTHHHLFTGSINSKHLALALGLPVIFAGYQAMNEYRDLRTKTDGPGIVGWMITRSLPRKQGLTVSNMELN